MSNKFIRKERSCAKRTGSAKSWGEKTCRMGEGRGGGEAERRSDERGERETNDKTKGTALI